jgi:hypothetical protein
MTPVSKFFPFLRRHLPPTLGHSLAHSLAYSPVHSPTRIAMPTATEAKASEENSAESQQSDSLPEGDGPQPEQRRRHPVPQEHHYFAANRGEDHDPEDRQWSYQN